MTVFKTVTGDLISTIVQSQSLDLVTIVIVINVVIDGFSVEDLKWLAYVIGKQFIIVYR